MNQTMIDDRHIRQRRQLKLPQREKMQYEAQNEPWIATTKLSSAIIKANGVLIGEGGQGQIYKITIEGREFAAKVIKGIKRIDRFRSEIQNSKSLHSKGRFVVEICAHEVNNKNSWYLMPFYRNGNLANARDMMFENSTQSTKDDIFLRLCKELEKIHDDGYIHRDIKAENILVDDSFNLMFADLGISLSIRDNENLTSTDEIIGSRHWTAPELHFGKVNSGSVAGDYFAMGKLLYFINTGKYLLGVGPYTKELVEDLPNHLQSICLALLNSDTTKRAKLWPECILLLDQIVKGTNQPANEIDLLGRDIEIDFIMSQSAAEVRWRKKYEEVKRAIISGCNTQRIIELLSAYVDGKFIEIGFDFTGSVDRAWKNSTGKSGFFHDPGHFTVFPGSARKIRYKPTVLVGRVNEEIFQEIEISVGIGNAELSYREPLNLMRSFSFSHDIDSPLLSSSIERTIREAEQCYYEILKTSVLDKTWVIK